MSVCVSVCACLWLCCTTYTYFLPSASWLYFCSEVWKHSENKDQDVIVCKKPKGFMTSNPLRENKVSKRVFYHFSLPEINVCVRKKERRREHKNKSKLGNTPTCSHTQYVLFPSTWCVHQPPLSHPHAHTRNREKPHCECDSEWQLTYESLTHSFTDTSVTCCPIGWYVWGDIQPWGVHGKLTSLPHGQWCFTMPLQTGPRGKQDSETDCGSVSFTWNWPQNDS